MNDTVHRRFRQTTAALVALLLAVSVLGPVGTVAAQPSVTVSQSADATTVAPGDSVSFTTEFTVTELNAPQLQVTTPSGWEITSQSAEGPVAYNDGTWTWLAGDEDGVDVSYTVEYTVSVPESASPGDYVVTADGSALSPSDSAATSDSDSTTITVQDAAENEAPSASFTASPSSVEVGESVSFDASASTDSDGSIASYEWDFDDGETATGESVTHAFDAAGDYDVTLTVTDDDGATDTTTQTVSVSEAPPDNQAPSAAFTVDPGAPEVGESATFDASASTDSDGSIASYEWDFDDGETATGESVTHAFDAVGEYDVELTVTDDDGATDSVTQTVSVVEVPTPASFQVSALNVESPVTQGDDASVTATVENTGGEEGTQTVALDVDGSQVDSESVTLAAGASQQVSFTVDTIGLSEGDHDVTVSTDDDSATATLEVTVEPPANEAPSAAFSSSPSDPETGETVTFDASASTDADGSIASYEWDFDDGATATGVTAGHAFESAGSYDVELTVTDDDGATDSVTQTIAVSEPTEPEPGLSTAVSLSPAEELLGVDATTTFDVVVEDADGGVGAYSLEVSLSDSSAAEITDVSVDEDALTDVQVASDGSAASVDAALLDTDQTGSVTVATITVAGTADGTTDVALAVDSLGTEAGQAYDVTETNGATLTVSELVVGASDQPAQDPDGDGVYEDVNGDGVVDELDVQLLFAERDSAVVQNSPDAFDFNGDGEFDILDVQALYYEEIASGEA